MISRNVPLYVKKSVELSCMRFDEILVIRLVRSFQRELNAKLSLKGVHVCVCGWVSISLRVIDMYTPT